MTLNISVVSRHTIYQSADYRLVDWRTKEPTDFATQKVVLAGAFGWNATICFAGVGRTSEVDIAEWLAARVGAIGLRDPFEKLLSELRLAEEWLASVPLAWRRHSFSVGAFVGGKAVFALVSNFERLNGPQSETPSRHLRVDRISPHRTTTYVSGQARAVSRFEKRQLAKLVERRAPPGDVYALLEQINRVASSRNNLISPGCFTTHVNIVGEGGGQLHGRNGAFVPPLVGPAAAQEAIQRLVDKQFGAGRATWKSLSTVRSATTRAEHEVRIREQPDNPEVHSNYGVFLAEKQKDFLGAEREYRTAIQLDGDHVNAHGNLAILMSNVGRNEEAERLYAKANALKPDDANVATNYSNFLRQQGHDFRRALDVVSIALASHPSDGRLRLSRAQVYLALDDGRAAITDARVARESGVDQAAAQSVFAFALQMSGATGGDCIAAYRAAIAVNPEMSALHLNLAQLLFAHGDEAQATAEFRTAMTLELDAGSMLEAQFYLLAHTSRKPEEIFRVIRPLVEAGARLKWNMTPTIEAVARSDPSRARRLASLAQGLSSAIIDEHDFRRLIQDW